MARGRKPKIKEQAVVACPPIDYAKLLKQFEEEQRLQLESLYKDLAKIKYKVDLALTHVGQIDGVDSLAEASFKAGRAYGPLDESNDRLEEILNDIFEKNDVDHWDDILENN
jgi:hypothetical protein